MELDPRWISVSVVLELSPVLDPVGQRRFPSPPLTACYFVSPDVALCGLPGTKKYGLLIPHATTDLLPSHTYSPLC